MIAEGFVLDVQCDHCPPRQPKRDQFVDRNVTLAYRAARAAGWKLYIQQGKAKCPACVRNSADRRDDR